jgi:NAD(P)-dependent dehydrogenase (short-subunit alcohol dehydrogenase family)
MTTEDASADDREGADDRRGDGERVENADRPPALIAGVGETLGAALARAFAGERPVALLARSGEFIDELAADLRNEGREAMAVAADVTDRERVRAAASDVRERFGPVGVVVHNASAPGSGGVDDCDAGAFEATWQVRAKGGYHLAREFTVDLRETNGTLLFAGTNYATEPSGRLVDWDSAAAATRGLARSLATELEPDGVHVAYVALAGSVVPSDAFGGGGDGDADDAHLVDGRMPANRVAAAFRDLAEQDRGAWTRELTLEPPRFVE